MAGLNIPAVIAHRGASGQAPENTIVAIARAAALGARWVEIDAKLTADGELILMHDDTLDRTTDGRGPVAQTTWDRIAVLDAGGWFSSDFRHEPVPTFRQFVAACEEFDLGANVEIKPCPGRERETGEAVARALREGWPSDRDPPLVSSFAAEALAAFRASAPGYPVGCLGKVVPDDLRPLAAFAAIHVDASWLRAADARRVNETGARLLVYTVNDPRQAARLFEQGVDAVFTDHPDRILPVAPRR
ncbi:MAG: glycerophosphodiester phosphodiesterase [Alphaproteobacteria bacterium]|nr:glycerophosphodiester phosphodiesterase [Alphaproteobacteria bacterium]